MTDTETNTAAMQTPSRLPPENGSSPKIDATEFCGFPVVISSIVPPNECWINDRGRIVGRIIF